MESSSDGVGDSVLEAFLDTLLPPNGALAGAGGLGLAGEFRRGAAEVSHLGTPALALLHLLPAGFAVLSAPEREDRLRVLEGSDPSAFAAVVNLAYNAYYSDPRVLGRIELETGYSARPPQPEGYHLEPFDESVLVNIRDRAPFWREA